MNIEGINHTILVYFQFWSGDKKKKQKRDCIILKAPKYRNKQTYYKTSPNIHRQEVSTEENILDTKKLFGLTDQEIFFVLCSTKNHL